MLYYIILYYIILYACINWERRNLYIFWGIKEEGGSGDAPSRVSFQSCLMFKILGNESEGLPIFFMKKRRV